MWIINLLLLIRFAAGKLLGDHVCQMEEKYTINVTEFVLRNSTVRKYQWCLNVPPRCSFYTTKLVNESQIVEKEVAKMVEKCCPGFHENATTNSCHQNCPECVHGHCDNGKCLCLLGFKGDNCNKECDQTEWGRNCANRCKCQRGTCSPENGTCTCPPGWKGNECEAVCDDGTYGQNCVEKCACSSPLKKCDPESGNCILVTTTSTTTTTTTTSKPTTTLKTTTPSPTTTTESTSKFDTQPTYPVLLQNNGQFTTNSNGLVSMKPTTILAAINHVQRTADNNIGKDLIETTSNYIVEQQYTTAGTRQDLNKDTAKEYNVDNRATSAKTTTTTVSSEMMKLPTLQDSTNAHKEIVEGSVLGVPVPIENYLNDEHKTGSSVIDHTQQSNKKNELVSSASVATAVTIMIIVVAVVIVGAKRMRNIRKRKQEQQQGGGQTKGLSTVSVYTHSIFHTPLPDPPPFENPIFITPIEPQTPVNNEAQRFEARVVCSMNYPPTQPSKDPRDYLYDHPPSTGSYRAASIPEPPDIDNSIQLVTHEPVYDEIPSSLVPTPISEPLPPYKSSSLYMNTCAKTRL